MTWEVQDKCNLRNSIEYELLSVKIQSTDNKIQDVGHKASNVEYKVPDMKHKLWNMSKVQSMKYKIHEARTMKHKNVQHNAKYQIQNME